jgi:murein DD-endopeptidase
MHTQSRIHRLTVTQLAYRNRLHRGKRNAHRSGDAVRAALIVMVIIANVSKNAAQVLVPPTASLDVQVSTAPIPVKIAGQWHLAYELHITNYRTVDVTLTRIDVIGDDPEGSLLASYEGEALAKSLARVGAPPDSSDKRTIGAGRPVIVFVWLGLDNARRLPSSLRHRISYHVMGQAGHGIATIRAGMVNERQKPPIVLAPPLSGGPWVALYDPSSIGGHRRASFAIDGKARIPARFAVDWVKLGDDGRAFHGDGSIPANYYGYGADVLAVADGVVADAVDQLSEPTVPITLGNEAGNYVVIDVGGGRFAFYEHLKPGSVRVRVGDRVHAAQVLARVGASGSVFSGPHLHFHVSDAKSPLGAEGLPFAFKRFDVLGAFESLDAFARGDSWAATRNLNGLRRLEMPTRQAVIRF